VKKLGPFGTIAKVARERKEKSQKRLEKCGFLARPSRMACGNAVTHAFGDSNGEVTPVTRACIPFECQ
jgi:hypothetical protein